MEPRELLKKLGDLANEASTEHPEVAAILFATCGAMCSDPADLRNIFIAATEVAQQVVDRAERERREVPS